MSLSKLALAAVAASLIGSAAAYADPPPPPPGGGMMMGGHGGSMMRGMFTPEERMMLFAQSMKATAGMTEDQRHDYRRQQRERIMGMSDGDRAKFKADLDGSWAALTPEQQADIKAKVDAFRAAHMGGMGRQGGQ
jgi:Spy/CpxP family protein refolding chaperone